ncbi:lasso peptide biosynthesis B2 protein [Herbidospora daliensis]|uniref:lasso peptide biosynthesis B2 protein n=1 Tax=Herbidospora daliensis TaxID=295585 RepID=UPI0007828B27|nr:lasso peptide biosynthesis B2 protein [Herbidospora daliensis]
MIYQLADDERGLVLVDVRTGECHVLNPPGMVTWSVLSSGGTRDDAVSALASRYPAVPGERLRADVDALLDDLHQVGLVPGGLSPLDEIVTAPGDVPAGPGRAQAVDVPMAAGPPGRPGARAAVFLMLAAVLLVFPFKVAHRLALRAGRNRPALDPATARRMAADVSRAAGWFPGRAACLQISLATVLWAGSRGRRADWCFGVLPDPYTFHAWIEADGEAITTGDEPSYHRLRPLP